MKLNIHTSSSTSLATDSEGYCRCRKPSVKELCRFLSDYSSLTIGCGATCIRLEHNISRIATTFGMKASAIILPRHISLTIVDTESGESETMMTPTAVVPISFYINTRLSELSWEIADGRIDFHEAITRLSHIATCKKQNRWILLMMVAIANASFCRLFGGDVAAMAIVGLATASGYFLKQCLMAYKADIRVIMILCALLSSLIGACGDVLHLGSTPHIALATSVLYLIPGVPYLNSFSDMLCRHYLCALSRFVDATILTACLSIGLCGGMLLTGTGMFR